MLKWPAMRASQGSAILDDMYVSVESEGFCRSQMCKTSIIVMKIELAVGKYIRISSSPITSIIDCVGYQA